MTIFFTYKPLLIGLLLVSCTLSIAQTYKNPDLSDKYSIAQFDSALDVYQQKRDTLAMAYTYLAYGKKLEKSNQLNDSILIVLRKSMDCFGIKKDWKNYYDLRGQVGYYYMYRPFLVQYAIEYLESSVTYFRSQNDYAGEIGPLINLTNIYIYANNYLPAEKLLNRGWWLNSQIHNKLNEGQLNASAADLYSRQKMYPKALAYAKTSLAISDSIKIDWLKAVSLYYTARCLEGLKKYDDMLPYLVASEKLTENNRPLIQLRKEIYDNLRNYYAIKKDFAKSYLYAMKLIKTQNIIYFDRREGDIHLSTEYRFLNEQKITIEKNSLEKKLAFTELDKLRSKQQFYNTVIFFLVILLILFLLVSFFFLRLRSANRRIKELMIHRDQFYTLVAHDLRGPISSLAKIGSVAGFLIKNNRTADLMKVANQVEAVSSQTHLLLTNMLEWGEANNYKLISRPQTVDLSTIVNSLYETAKPFADLKQILMSMDIPAELEVFVDPKAISTIIRNMIDNAQKNTPSGGVINLFAEKLDETKQIAIRVKDSGQGIATDQLAYIQQVFSGEVKPEIGDHGLGLGIILMASFAQKSRVILDVSSEVGIGSCFSLLVEQH